MNEDMTLEMMVQKGFIQKVGKDRWQLTAQGRKALEEMVRSDPKFYAKEFPEWIKIEWVH